MAEQAVVTFAGATLRIMSDGEPRIAAARRGAPAIPAQIAIGPRDLAPQIIDDVAASLRQLSASGAAILVAEQNAGFAERIADETILIRTGRISNP